MPIVIHRLQPRSGLTASARRSLNRVERLGIELQVSGAGCGQQLLASMSTTRRRVLVDRCTATRRGSVPAAAAILLRSESCDRCSARTNPAHRAHSAGRRPPARSLWPEAAVQPCGSGRRRSAAGPRGGVTSQRKVATRSGPAVWAGSGGVQQKRAKATPTCPQEIRNAKSEIRDKFKA